MEHILIKVYGHISPKDTQTVAACKNAAGSASPACEECVDEHPSMVSIQYEGMFFPMDELFDALRPCMTAETEGRIDYIDMDEWTLTRYSIANGLVTSNTVSLNHVMDHSGH